MNFTARDRLKLLSGAAALALIGCGGGSSVTPSPPPPPTPPPPPPPASYAPADGLFKNSFRNKFLVGAAVTPAQLSETSIESNILITQFNSITAENEMKPEALSPSEGTYTFDDADTLTNFAEIYGASVRGHTLLWHRATPDYFFQGTPAEVRARLEAYVTAVVTHFKGKVYAWDVVNEVVSDDDGATAPYRNSNWYQAAGGPEYIDWAFQAARAADPDVLLFINDYSTEIPSKRARLLEVVKDLQDRGIPIDGVGHQAHIQAATPATDVLAAIDDVDAQFMGLENHVTELDISIYNDPLSCFISQTGCAADYGEDVPQSAIDDQAQKYRDLYTGFAARPSVTSVTTWGVTDRQSWLNTWPVNRNNYPLLYDRNYNAKKALQAILDPSFVI